MIITKYKKRLQIALKKAQGTLTKVEKMIESEEYCPKIVQMISAAEGLLRGAKLKILENHLQTCGHEKMALANEEDRAKFAKELVKILDISSRK